MRFSAFCVVPLIVHAASLVEEEKEAANHRRRRVAALKEVNALPSYQIVMGSGDADSTLSTLLDSSDSSTLANTTHFLKVLEDAGQVVADINMEVVEDKVLATLSKLNVIISKWRSVARREFDWHYNTLTQRPVLSDTVLSIPVGHRDIVRSWPGIEGLMSSSALPEEIIFVTGYDSDLAEKYLDVWLAYRELILTQLIPSLPKSEVTVRWLLHRGYLGAAVSRSVAARSSTKKIVFGLDADDFLTPDSLKDRYRYLLKHPRADMLLNGLIYLEEYEEEKSNSSEISSSQSNPSSSETAEGEAEDGEAPEAEELTPLIKFVRSLAKAFRISYEIRANQYGEDEEDVARAIDGEDVQEELHQFNRDFPKWYKPMAEAEKAGVVQPGSLLGLPNIYHIKDCAKRLGEISALELEQVGKYNYTAELESFNYLQKLCLVIKNSENSELKKNFEYPRFVRPCANGWHAIYRELLEVLPTPRLQFGEDALINYVAHQAGFRIVCDASYRSGIYNTYHSDLGELLLFRLDE